MIFEISFGLLGGVNFGLEKSWKIVEDLMRKYPGAVWRKVVNRKKSVGKYIIEVE